MGMIFHPTLKTISRFIDGGHSTAKLKKIGDHLERCDRCRQQLETLRNMEPALTSTRQLSATFKTKVVSSLKDIRRIKTSTCAEIKKIIGQVMVYRNGDNKGVEAFPGMALLKGDTLRALGNSLALVELADGSTLYLNKETEIHFPSARYSLSLQVGELFAMMKPQKKAFEILTPSAVLAVIGTDFDAKVTEKKRTLLQVLKGKVSFKNESGSTIVKKKRQVEATKDAKPIPKKIKDTRTIYNWTMPMKRKKTEQGWIMNKLYLVIPAILAVGILIGGYFVYQEYFAYELPSDYKTSETLNSSVSPGETSSVGPGETSSLSPSESSSKTDALELVSPYTQEGLSWRTNATIQLKDRKWIDFYETVIRSNVISVDEDNGARVLITIENVKVSGDYSHNEVRLGMIGRQFEYWVSPEGKSHSLSIADVKPLEYAEIEFYGEAMEISDVSGLFQKNVLTQGDQWTVQFEDKVPGYPSSYIKEVEKYQFVNYEIEGGIQYAIVRSDVTGSVGGNIPIQRHIEPKAIHYGYLDQLTFNTKWEYRIDVKSGRVVSGSAIGQSSDIKGTVTSVIQGRRVPVKQTVEQELGDLNRTLFTVEYLQ